MEIYQTLDHPLCKLEAFEKWLDKNVGTEYERCFGDEDEDNLTIFDLSPNEVKAIRKIDTLLETLEFVDGTWVDRDENFAYPNWKLDDILEHNVKLREEL